MKTLLTTFTLVFTLMFSSTSFAKWTEGTTSERGDTFYLDYEGIRQHDEFVFFWLLMDFLKPNEGGNLSFKRYHQGDCKLFRMKFLSYVLHQQPMGRDVGTALTEEDPKWYFPSPKSYDEHLLTRVCRATE